MNYLTNFYGSDIFSVIHEYLGQIIEEISCCHVNYYSLSSHERLLLYSTIRNEYIEMRQFLSEKEDRMKYFSKDLILAPYNTRIDKLKIKIDNQIYILFHLYDLRHEGFRSSTTIFIPKQTNIMDTFNSKNVEFRLYGRAVFSSCFHSFELNEWHNKRFVNI